MNDASTDDAVPAGPWIGRRNVAYLVFLGLCLVLAALGMLMTAGGDAAGRGMGAIVSVFLYAAGTIPFFIWNLIGFFVALGKGRPARTPAIGILLPILSAMVGGFVMDVLWRVSVR